MVLQDIILAITTTLSIVSILLVWKLHSTLKSTMGLFKNKISDMDIDTKISGMISSSQPIKGVNDIASTLFKNIKEKFGFQARSYLTLIDEIKTFSGIDDDLKAALIDFFDNMIHISYRKESIDPEEEEDIKHKVKIILKRLSDY